MRGRTGREVFEGRPNAGLTGFWDFPETSLGLVVLSTSFCCDPWHTDWFSIPPCPPAAFPSPLGARYSSQYPLRLLPSSRYPAFVLFYKRLTTPPCLTAIQAPLGSQLASQGRHSTPAPGHVRTDRSSFFLGFLPLDHWPSVAHF